MQNDVIEQACSVCSKAQCVMGLADLPETRGVVSNEAQKLLERDEEEMAWRARRQAFMGARQLLARRIAVETSAAGG
jgi:hypothetical protein